MKPKATLNSTTKAIKRKIITLKTTKEINNSIRLSAYKTRKLNPQPNLEIRNKGLSGNLENTEEEVLSLNQEENNTQDAAVEKNEDMNKTRSSPPPAIPTKNRFKVLQPQETSLSQRQDHPQSITTNEPRIQHTTVEIIRKKNEKMRNKASTKTTSLVGTSHIRDKTNDTRINIPPSPHRGSRRYLKNNLLNRSNKKTNPIDKATEGIDDIHFTKVSRLSTRK
jgi:hypothetical protein